MGDEPQADGDRDGHDNEGECVCRWDCVGDVGVDCAPVHTINRLAIERTVRSCDRAASKKNMS